MPGKPTSQSGGFFPKKPPKRTGFRALKKTPQNPPPMFWGGFFWGVRVLFYRKTQQKNNAKKKRKLVGQQKKVGPNLERKGGGKVGCPTPLFLKKQRKGEKAREKNLSGGQRKKRHRVATGPRRQKSGVSFKTPTLRPPTQRAPPKKSPFGAPLFLRFKLGEPLTLC